MSNPTNQILVDLPADYQGYRGTVPIVHEEDAVCWLWAHPALFPWKRPVTWLYTPVVGNSRWPGDLWGVDSEGNLLIIEVKRLIGNHDAFADFIPFHDTNRVELTGSHWLSKWDSHRTAEFSFPDSISERPRGRTDGMLPRSNRRKHIRRWSTLADITRKYIESDSYRDMVRDNLQRRERMGNPAPFYCGLFIELVDQERSLQVSCIHSAMTLMTIVGPDHVLAMSAVCKWISTGKAQLSIRHLGIDRDDYSD